MSFVGHCKRYQLADFLFGVFLVIITAIFYCNFLPYCRPFSWDDPTINYPYTTHVLFPTWTLFFFLFLALCMYTVFFFAFGGCFWPWIKAQLFAFIAQLLIVSLLKLYAGRIRPDYLDRLRSLGFNENSYAKSGLKGITQAEYYCELGRTYPILRDGRFSFPSGHSSSSFSVFVFMSLFLFAKLQPLAREGSFLLLFTSLSPLIFAFLCAVSRTRDYWHNFDDIIAGALIGSSSALLCFYNTFRIASNGVCVARQTEVYEDGERNSSINVINI